MKAKLSFCAALAFLVAGCVSPTITQKETARYTPVSFSQLPHWQNDDLSAFQESMLRSCSVFEKRDASARIHADIPQTGTVRDWLPACAALKTATPATLRPTLEQFFQPYHVTSSAKTDGLFTGYYEKELRGSLTKTARYNVPLYKRPPELVMVELGDFRPELKGQRIAGKVIDGKLKPFADRKAIEDNAELAGRNLELLWVDDADAAFFLHIQGSGRVTLEDGRVMRVGYDGQNGHVYHAIGKELIARGALAKENVSLQTIRAWLKAHPAEAAALRHTNPSFIFFRLLAADAGAVGAQGVPLTPMRSLAVDPRFIPYGAPVWLQFENPEQPTQQLNRLVVAQDTGGAIRGVVRGDFFWGSGARAEELAGIMKSKGSYWILLPRGAK